jgi:hypothetical protein
MKCPSCGIHAKGSICDYCDSIIFVEPEKVKKVKVKKVTEKLKKQMNGKSLPKLKKELQEIFNKFIRLRDQKNGVFKCISCGEFKQVDQMNAGHYHCVGNNEAVRYNEFNVNGQCVKCNLHEHANLLGYQQGLIKKYGKKVVELLEIQRHNKSKMGKFEHELLIKDYKAKVKALERKHKGFYEPEGLADIL